MSSFFRRASVSALAITTGFCSAFAQQPAGQPPSNYHGPDLFGVCVYVMADTSYYSQIFEVSGYFKFQAQNAFHEYAVAQAKGAALKGAGCRWSTSKDEVTTQKDADKRLLGLAGRSAKGVETGWAYNPATAASASPATTARTASAGSRTAASQTAASVSPTAAAKTTTAAASTPAAATASSTTPAGSTSNSIAGNAAADLSGAKTSATQSVNSSVSTAVSSTTASATQALQGLFHKRPTPANGAADQNAAGQKQQAATPVATAQNAQPLGFGNSESPLASTAEAHHIEGLVADVSGKDVVINVGLQAGVQVGAKLSVMHAVRTVKDPATGKVLRTIEDKVGDLTITSSDAGSAMGTFSGATEPKVGDTVRTPTP